jgi:hypothetical protein
MSRLRNNVWHAAVFVSLALMLIGASEANARGGGGHGGGGGGHASGGGSSLRSVSGSGPTLGRGLSGTYSASGAFTNPKPSPKPRTSHVVRNYGGGRGGYYNNYNNNNLPNQQNYYQQQGTANGQVFSGAAHIDPSQYGHYVQSYQWPSSKP